MFVFVLLAIGHPSQLGVCPVDIFADLYLYLCVLVREGYFRVSDFETLTVCVHRV